MYSVEFYNKKAKRKFEKLDKQTADRLYESFVKFKDPFKLDIKKMVGKADFYRIRIGELRSIVLIDFKNKILYVVDFDFRGKIY